jgi:hypothetical protein
MSSINEFKLIGNGYIAKNGDSANVGTDPTLPKAHPADFALLNSSDVAVIGAGSYFGGGQAINNYFGDGKVVWDLNNTSSITARNFESAGLGSIRNIKFKNFLSIRGSATNVQCRFYECIFEQATILLERNGNQSNGFVPAVVKSIYIGETLQGFGGGSEIRINGSFPQINNIFLVNTFIYPGRIGGTILGNYVPKNCQIFSDSISIGTSISNNMINGLITIAGITYELKRMSDGSTRPDADPLIPDLIDIYPNVYVNGNFCGEAKFLDVIGKIVEPSSDLLKRSTTFGFVGGVRPGRSTILLGNTDPNTEITLFQVEQVGNGYKVATGETWGQIDIIRKESNSVVELGVKNPITPLAFDSNETPGSSLNNNVPDSWPLTDPGTDPGKLPNRLTYLLRTSQNNNKPTTDGQWDNDASSGGVAGVFYVQEWFTKPTLTQTGGNTYGNAEPEGYGGTVNPINARWVHYRIYLRNDRDY